MIPSYKSYPALSLAKPQIDKVLQVPNKYFKLINFHDNPSSWLNIPVGDTKIPLYKMNGTIEVALYVTEETDYKYYTIFLAVDRDFTNPTYIATTHTRPKVKLIEGTSFFLFEVHAKNKIGRDIIEQECIIFKSALEIIFLKPITLIGGNLNET